MKAFMFFLHPNTENNYAIAVDTWQSWLPLREYIHLQLVEYWHVLFHSERVYWQRNENV